MRSLCFSLLCLATSSLSLNPLNAGPIFETYTEDWSCFNFPSPAPCSICSPVCQFFWSGRTLNIAFASFNFPGGDLGGMTETQAQIKQVIDFVHSQGGKVKISFGGATLPYHIEQGAQWPNVAAMAQNIATILNDNVNYGFDGADFDIETDPQNPPANFAASIVSLLTNLRQLVGASKIISLTLPAQGWGTYIETVSRNLATAQVNGLDVVDYFFFMEYDIWIPQGGSYTQQIAQDILTYGPGPLSTNWNVPFNKMMLGLMPGLDDLGRALSLTDVIGNGQPNTGLINTVVLHNGLYGVGTWDLNRDYAGIGGQSSLAYSTAIVLALQQNANIANYSGGKAAPLAKRPYSSNIFQRQNPPPHGPP